MPKVALLSEFDVKPRDLNLFLEAARREVDAVRANEPTCLVFEVVLLNEGEGRGVFVEIFKDEAAAVAHRGFPHYAAFHDQIKALDVRWSSRRGVILDTN